MCLHRFDFSRMPFETLAETADRDDGPETPLDVARKTENGDDPGDELFVDAVPAEEGVENHRSRADALPASGRPYSSRPCLVPAPQAASMAVAWSPRGTVSARTSTRWPGWRSACCRLSSPVASSRAL